MTNSTREAIQIPTFDPSLPANKQWFNDPASFEVEDDEVDADGQGLAERPCDTRRRLEEAGEWYGPAGAKVLYVYSKLRYETLLSVDIHRLFRKRIIASHLANCEAFQDGDEADGLATNCLCFEGTRSFLPKSVTYHALRKASEWEQVQAARVAFVRRLVAEGNSPSRANDLSWRMLEDLLFWSETESGFDAERIKVEILVMLTFGEDRQHFASGSSDNEQSAANLDVSPLVQMLRKNAIGWLPTTVIYAYKAMDLWDLAERCLQRRERDRGELGNRSTNVVWQELTYLLATHRDRDELRESLRKQLQRPTS